MIYGIECLLQIQINADCNILHIIIIIIIAFITMLTNATSEQQTATQDSNCIIEHKALARRP